MTSVDMLEFDEAAVWLFVDATYSGTAEGVTRELFRDINKMANVFEIAWLSDKCSAYYRNLVDCIKTPSYEELHFIFEEAGFVFEKLKTTDYLNLATKKIEELGYKQQFIDQYLENADRLSTKKLDMVIELAGTEVHCVVQTLTNQLSELLKVQGSSLPVSCEYLLDNLNLYVCKKSNRILFDQLFEYLQQLPDENMRWTFQLYQKLKKRSSFKFLVPCRAATKIGKSSSSTVSRCNSVPNLYHNLDMNMTYDELLNWLSSSEQVTSMLMAIEAVWTWSWYKRRILKAQFTVNMSVLSVRLKDMLERRDWSLLPSQFSKSYLPLCTKNSWWSLPQPLKLTPFCSSPQQTCSYVIIDCVDTCTKPITLLSKENKLSFYFKHPLATSCNLHGECGFILETVQSEAAVWKLKLCTEKEDYINEPVHFHDEIRAESMHIYFVHVDAINHFLSPISWLGWLHSDNAVEQRNSWESIYEFAQGSRFKVLYKLDTSSNE